MSIMVTVDYYIKKTADAQTVRQLSRYVDHGHCRLLHKKDYIKKTADAQTVRQLSGYVGHGHCRLLHKKYS